MNMQLRGLERIQIPKGATVKLALGTVFAQRPEMLTVEAPENYQHRTIKSLIDYVLTGTYNGTELLNMRDKVERVMSKWRYKVSINAKMCSPKHRLSQYICDIAQSSDQQSPGVVVIELKVASRGGQGLGDLVRNYRPVNYKV